MKPEIYVYKIKATAEGIFTDKVFYTLAVTTPDAGMGVQFMIEKLYKLRPDQLEITYVEKLGVLTVIQEEIVNKHIENDRQFMDLPNKAKINES